QPDGNMSLRFLTASAVRSRWDRTEGYFSLHDQDARWLRGGKAIQPVLHVGVAVRGVMSSTASSMREKGNCAVSLTVLTRLRWSASNRHRQRDWPGINMLRM